MFYKKTNIYFIQIIRSTVFTQDLKPTYINKYHMKMLLGDFNTKVGRENAKFVGLQIVNDLNWKNHVDK